MANDYTEEEQKLAEALRVADEDLSLDDSLKAAREKIVKKKEKTTTKQEQPIEGGGNAEPTPTALSKNANDILKRLEESLLDLPITELKKFGEEVKEIIKRLSNPAYAQMKESEERKAAADKKMLETIATLPPEQAEMMKALMAERRSAEMHYIRAQTELDKPKEKPKQKYRVDGKEYEWSSMGNPSWVKALLDKDEGYKSETNKKKKGDLKREILERYLVKG